MRNAAVMAILTASACTGAPHARPSDAPDSVRTRSVVTQVTDSFRVPILVYHSVAPHHPGQTVEQRQLDVSPSNFRAQMDYIRAHYDHVVSLATMVDALRGKTTLPARSVVITFDDGWETQYREAFPILKQLGFTATFFVYSQPIGRDPLYMTWDQLRELRAAGMTIGCHSRTHPLLTKPGVSLTDEIVRSRDEIERNLGAAPTLFAYPYGVSSARVVAKVREAGYLGAREYPGGVWNTPADLYTLHAVLATDDMTVFEREVNGSSPERRATPY